MYVTKKELEKYGVIKSNKELESIFNSIGHEVNSVEVITNDKIVIGKIISAEPIEGSDKLNICQVNVGQTNLQIVCGAKNVLSASYVAVALPGCKIGNFEIVKRELFKTESNGMICSLSELGFSFEEIPKELAEGILHLNQIVDISDNDIGKNVFQFCNLEDTIFEIDITPNREECKSYFGILQDLVPIFNNQTNLIDIPSNDHLVYALKHHLKNTPSSIANHQNNNYQFTSNKLEISFDFNEIQLALGIQLFINADEVVTFLKKLNYNVELSGENIICSPPLNRLIENKQDIWFDLLRYHLEQLNQQLSEVEKSTSDIIKPNQQIIPQNATEVVTYTLISDGVKNLYDIKSNREYLKVQSPLSNDKVFMRQLIFPSLIEVLKSNLHNHDEKNFFIAEYSDIYWTEKGETKSESHFALLCHNEINQNEIENYITEKKLTKKKCNLSFLNPSNSFDLFLDNEYVGFCGSIDYSAIKHSQIKNVHQVFILELNQII